MLKLTAETTYHKPHFPVNTVCIDKIKQRPCIALGAAGTKQTKVLSLDNLIDFIPNQQLQPLYGAQAAQAVVQDINNKPIRAGDVVKVQDPDMLRNTGQLIINDLAGEDCHLPTHLRPLVDIPAFVLYVAGLKAFIYSKDLDADKFTSEREQLRLLSRDNAAGGSAATSLSAIFSAKNSSQRLMCGNVFVIDAHLLTKVDPTLEGKRTHTVQHNKIQL
eukprot:UN02720